MRNMTIVRTRLKAALAIAVFTFSAPLLAQDRVTTVIAQARTALGGEQKLTAVKAISAVVFSVSVGYRDSTFR